MQAVVLQTTGAQLPAWSPITAQFDLWNSSGGRKRISVLSHDGDFSDLSVCTFWLDPFTPRRTCVMSAHTTQDGDEHDHFEFAEDGCRRGRRHDVVTTL